MRLGFTYDGLGYGRRKVEVDSVPYSEMIPNTSRWFLEAEKNVGGLSHFVQKDEELGDYRGKPFGLLF